MRASSLRPGDRVEVDVRGVTFTATIEEAEPRAYVRLKDPSPYVTWKFVKPGRVKRKLETQGQIEVAT